jgi:hypothetical protein
MFLFCFPTPGHHMQMADLARSAERPPRERIGKGSLAFISKLKCWQSLQIGSPRQSSTSNPNPLLHSSVFCSPPRRRACPAPHQAILD